jgi:beta-glucanase (GH16 family)
MSRLRGAGTTDAPPAHHGRRGALAVLALSVSLVLIPSSTQAGKATDPSGRTAARQMIWAEDFNGRAGSRPSRRKWNFDVGGGGWGNRELESNTARRSNAVLDGRGHLVISARAETYTGRDGQTRSYTSARIQTLGKFEFTYGLVEASIRVPAGQGLLPQFWMLGNDGYRPGGWPASGEIDAMEVLGSHPNVAIGTVHGPWPWAPHGVGTKAYSATSLASSFHVYGVEWSHERIRFMLDGNVYRTITPSSLQPGSTWPFQRPNFLLLDVAVGGNWPGSPDASTRFPARMYVDWVRVWR